jgi:hypothetical protein
MSCSLNSIVNKAEYDAAQLLEKNSKSYKQIRPGVYEARVAPNMGLNRLYERGAAIQNIVSNWAEKKYGPKFKFGWVKMDRSHPSKITLNLNAPLNLVKAIEVKLGLNTIENANVELSIQREAKEVSYDPALEEQEFQSDEDFYKEVSETFNLKDVRNPEIYSDLEYNQNKEFDYNSTTDTQIVISDVELYELLNNDNIC